MKKIIFATGNADKLIEVRSILSDVGIEIVTMADVGLDMEIDEVGSTFEENAIIKATAVWYEYTRQHPYSRRNTLCMADDSGLCIDFLDGEPGIKSARFLGHDTPYDIKCAQILDMMKDVPDEKRGARFVASIACVGEKGMDMASITTIGVMEGMIAHSIEGSGGFGYDPIFYVPEHRRTAASLTADEKNAISHRGVALRLMKEKLVAEHFI